MRKLFLGVFLGILFQSNVFAQDSPFLRVETKRNILTQKVEVFEGSKPLRKQDVMLLLSEDPEAWALYQKSLRRQKINVALSVLNVGLFAGSTFLVISPQSQSSTFSNLFWPITLGTLGVGIVSGILSGDVRNLTREAVDLYNFGNQNGPPVYFQENRIDQQIFSFKIPISGKPSLF